MQYKIKNHQGTYQEPAEIQRIIKQELGGESLEWTVGKAYLASKPSVRPFIILLENDLLICTALRASNVYSSTHVSQQSWQKSHSQKVACVLVCWHDTAINSTPFHYHSLPMLVHLYVIILLLSPTTQLSDVLCSRHMVFSKDTPLVTGTEAALQLGTLVLCIGIVWKPWSF